MQIISDGLPVAVLLSELRHAQLPLPLELKALPGKHKVAGKPELLI